MASHEIDGVRKEKERLTAAWTSLLSQLMNEFLAGKNLCNKLALDCLSFPLPSSYLL